MISDLDRNMILAKLGLILSIIGFALSAISLSLVLSQCIADPFPYGATAQADTAYSDTALCLAPECYPEIRPAGHP